MQFGAHIYLWIERWSDDTLWLLDRAKSLGLSSLEISVGDDVRFDPRLTRERARDLGLALIVSPGGVWPVECDISVDDPAQRERGVKWHQRNIELAGDLGAVAYCGAIYGHPGTVMRRKPPADEYPRTAENLHVLAEHARRHGVDLVLEPMSHFRTHMVNTPEQAMRLITLADHPRLKVLLDTYHMVTEIRDYPAAARTVASHLWGIHACENDRGTPGTGLIPWPAFLATVRELAPNIHVVFESYNSGIGDFAERRGMFHGLCPDGDAFVKHGMQAIGRHWRGG